MSHYVNFIKDFPLRGEKILQEYFDKATTDDREVTLMLSIAFLSLTFPLERLGRRPDGLEHPSNDKSSPEFQTARSQYDNLCGKAFIDSKLLTTDQSTWKYKELERNEEKKSVEEWLLSAHCIPNHMKVKVVLTHLRNAFAHGSLFTNPNRESEIDTIAFLTRRMDHDNSFSGCYNMLSVEVQDFKMFLEAWMKFLKTLRIA